MVENHASICCIAAFPALWDDPPAAQSGAIDGLDGASYKPRPSSQPYELNSALRTGSMPTTDLVAPNAIIPALKVNGKKQALQEIAAKAAVLTSQNERAILEILLQREKLGSTAVGNGVAIPHGKLPKLNQVFGLFARLERPVDFDALDGQPVDLIFLLLAPEGAGADHLKALARVARLLRDSEVARKLRSSHDAEALYAVLAMPSASAA
jgi:PTS system nitrogen regulatory IIA component